MNISHSDSWINLKVTNLLSKHNLGYYENSANDLPKRHFHTRFIKDYRQWATRYIDFVHYTLPLNMTPSDGFQFPGEYAGQYGVYDAIHHIYSQSKELKPLLKEESLLINKNYFGSDLEKAILDIRTDFRNKHHLP